MFESPGAIGPKHWLGRNARNNTEKWMEELIEKVRQGTVNPPENTALSRFSFHRELDGNLLDIKIASVEVINIIRPIVAIAIFINFIALAVQHYPEERKKLQTGDEKYAEMFIQEVRRFYPFFPFVLALVKEDFTLQIMTRKFGIIQMCSTLLAFPIGKTVPLDLYPKVAVIILWDIAVQVNG